MVLSNCRSYFLRGIKHVLCEKAFTTAAAQAKHLIDLARSKNLFLMEAMWSRILPVFEKVKTVLADGVIGDVNLVCGVVSFRAQVDPSHRLLDPHLAGGTVLDIGVYALNFADMFLGTPTTIQSASTLDHQGVDRQVHMLLQYPSGAIANLQCSILQTLPYHSHLIGTGGTIEFPSITGTQTAIVRPNDGDPFTISCPHQINGFEYQITETVRCIQNGLIESDIISHEHTLRIMQQMDTVRSQCGIRYPFEK